MKTTLSACKNPGIQFLALAILMSVGYQSNAQCNNAPTLKFHGPQLIAGSAGQPGAIYKFSQVIPGVDAQIEVLGLYGGATLYNIDDTAGVGYYDAFQPYVGASPNDTSYIDWRISFKNNAGSDTSLACLAVTGVDVDGNGSSLKEFIEAATPGSISVDPYTALQVSFDGVRSKAVSTVANEPLIDTVKLANMFQMNFTNISTLLYRNGAVSTYGSEQIRQTCIYFKPFFQTYTLLPIRLLSFAAKSALTGVEVTWTATNEEYADKYIVQKSADGIAWTDIKSVDKGNDFSKNNYFVTDRDKNNSVAYYRLKQIDAKGLVSYSRVVRISEGNLNKNIIHNTVFSSNLNVQVASSVNDEFTFEIYSLQGSRIKRQVQKISAGMNSFSIGTPSGLAPGMYMLMTTDRSGKQVYGSKLVKG